MNARSIAPCGRLSALGLLILTSLLGNVSARAQTLPATQAPEVSLSVNQEFEPVSSQAWPLLFEVEVYHPSVGQGNGNVVPITLSLPTGSWSDAVHLVVRDSSGNSQTWPINLAFRPTGSEGSIVLDDQIEGRLAWSVPPSITTSIPAGTYEAVAILDTSSTTAQGAFNGMVASNPVTITIQSEPSPLPVSLQEQKYMLLATYDLLQGNSTQATADLNTLLTNQPNSIVGMMLIGDLLNLQGQPLASLQRYDDAVSAFFTANPVVTEPPTWLIDRQAGARASLISLAGVVGTPQVTFALADQGLQSAGVYFFDFQLTNSGTGLAELTTLTQFSYLTVLGTGQVTYDTALSPQVPFGAYSLAPNASATARIYLDVPASVTQFTIGLSGTNQDSVGTEYNFSGTRTVTVNSTGGGNSLTITAANATQQYGQSTPSLNNVTYSGFVNGDTPSSLNGTLVCTTTATQSNPVGNYPITCSGLSSPNYVITYVPGTLAIVPAPLTLTANNSSVQFGQLITLSGASYSGFVNGDTSASLGGTLNCTTTATTSGPVGTYPIICSGLTSTNYLISFVQGLLTISPAPLTIAANNASRAYGVPNPPLNNVTASGFVNGDTLASLSGTLVCATTATPTSPAGSYPVLCSGLSSPNYSITYSPGTMTITSDVLTVTANSATRQYGSANPMFTATFVGFVNGDTVASLSGSLACTTTATPASSVSGGPYPINCSGLTSPNYAITFLPGALTITPAPLTVAASNATRPYGANNPAFTGTFTGLLNSDAVTATFATAATPASRVGAYPIVPTVIGAPNVLSNYTAVLINGMLIVSTETTSLSLTLSPASIVVGQSTTATITLTARDMVIPMDPSVLAPITVTSPAVSDILSNNGVCTPVPSIGTGVAICTVTITSVEPNGRTLNVSFAGSAALLASSGTADLIVTAPLLSKQVCIPSDFRNVAVGGGNTIWFNGIFKVRGLDGPRQKVNLSFFNAGFHFQYADASGNLVTVNHTMPDAHILIDPSVSVASTSFDSINNVWTTTVPWDFDDSSFLTGMPWLVPSGGIPADVEPVTVCGTVYSSFSTDNSVLDVKPMDSDHDNPASNYDRAGTPENYKQFVIPGARGKGGRNYTGSYSGGAQIE
jgi:hypothetical protein